jgi:methionyl-tRNA formyltransferase
VKQDDSQATLAPILRKEDGLMDFQRTAMDLWNRLRGFQPWPGAFTSYRGKKLNVTAAKPFQGASSDTVAGTLQLEAHRLLVACGQQTALELLEVQPEGKKRMPARDFLNGYRPQSGEVLGQ